MFDRSIDGMVKNFTGQFEEQSGQLTYRKFGKGAAIPVSAAERDAFIEAYRRAVKRSMWYMMASLSVAVMLGLALAYFLDVSLDDDSSAVTAIVCAITLGAILCFTLYTLRLYRAPLETLHRLPIAEERSSAEMRKITIQKTSYGQLAGSLAIAAWLIFRASDEAGWWRYLLGLTGIALVGLTIARIARKFLFDRAEPTP